MEEKNNSQPTSLSKKRKIRIPKIPKSVIYIFIALSLLGITFIAGTKFGADREKKKLKTDRASSVVKKDKPPISNRWNAIGTVEEITEGSIKIVDSRKKEYNAKLTNDTIVTDRKGTKLSAKDIKKDAKIIISGEKDGDNLKATRIRIQN